MKTFGIDNFKLYLIILLLLYLPYYFYNIFLMQIRADILLITIFYFSIVRKYSLSLIFFIVVGLLNDQLYGRLLGTETLIFSLVAIFAQTNINSLYKQKFSVIFASFVLIVILTVAIKCLTGFIHPQHAVVFRNEILDGLATLLMYPLLHYLYSVKLDWFTSDE